MPKSLFFFECYWGSFFPPSTECCSFYNSCWDFAFVFTPRVSCALNYWEYERGGRRNELYKLSRALLSSFVVSVSGANTGFRPPPLFATCLSVLCQSSVSQWFNCRCPLVRSGVSAQHNSGTAYSVAWGNGTVFASLFRWCLQSVVLAASTILVLLVLLLFACFCSPLPLVFFSSTCSLLFSQTLSSWACNSQPVESMLLCCCCFFFLNTFICLCWCCLRTWHKADATICFCNVIVVCLIVFAVQVLVVVLHIYMYICVCGFTVPSSPFALFFFLIFLVLFIDETCFSFLLFFFWCWFVLFALQGICWFMTV